jgi:predicted unusual protein kinase regulating ubiquinone biosynthesis (AarF/ABC1/UbiB family)
MMDELDYVHEAERADQYRAACARLSGITVPRVYRELTTRRVLTMEFLEGETFKEFLHHREGVSNDEKFRVARLLTMSLWGPFLLSGLVHSDPHPGNFILMKDGRVGVLDFGAIKQLSPRWVAVNRRLFHAVAENQPVDMMALCFEAGFEFTDPDAARPFIEEILAIIARPLRTDDFDFSQAGMSRDLRNLTMKNAPRMVGIKPPKESVQFFRAVGGMSQNLENLGARGNYSATHVELLALAGA